MGKRSDFPRVARDLYVTPPGPVAILSPFLGDVDGFAEPCCGDGALIRHLEALGHRCALALDQEPRGEARGYARTGDALDLVTDDLWGSTHIVTNPPWPARRGRDGEPTMAMIRHFARIRPTWLLLSADFMHNGYATEVMRYCQKIVSIGRIQWMPGTKYVGMDNAAWYLFDQRLIGPPIFYPRDWRPGPIFTKDIEELL